MNGVTRRRAFMFRRGLFALATGSAGLAAIALVLARGPEAAPARAALSLLAAAATAVAMDRWLRPRHLGAVPVLTYHSVAPPSLRERWDRIGWGNLTVTPALFDRHLAWLARRGYRSTTLDELHAHVAGHAAPLRKAVVITFDDGYVDNWVHAAPLLERRGFQATVFVSSDFVEPDGAPRPTLADAWAGRVREAALPVTGYMRWSELRELERRGTFRVEAHGTTHDWCFAGEEIVDFYHDPDQYIWMFWNHDRARKVFWQECDREAAVGLGRPVYAYDRSQVRRRCFAPPEVGDALVGHVAASGGREFFRRPGWRDALQERARALTSGAPAPARYETEAEYWARVRADFGGNVADIEREIGRRPHFLAWPGNAFTDRLRRFALEELAIAATTESGGLNRPGDDARWIGRVHIESRYEGTPLARLDELDFIARLEVFAGNGWFLALTIAVGVARRLFRRGARRVAPEAAPEGFRVMEAVP